MRTEESRLSTRFIPDENCLAWIDYKCPISHKPKKLVGLVADESRGGCSLVLLSKEDWYAVGRLTIKVGRLSEVSAVVVWSKIMEGEICKLGLKYKLT